MEQYGKKIILCFLGSENDVGGQILFYCFEKMVTKKIYPRNFLKFPIFS